MYPRDKDETTLHSQVKAGIEMLARNKNTLAYRLVHWNLIVAVPIR
jgi:hypothetical protein